MYQLADVFISKYSYIQINISKFQEFKDNETWFANIDNPNYQLVRVTFNEADKFIYDNNRVDEYVQYMKSYAKKEIKFLDIHISALEYNEEYEPYEYLNIEDGYVSGVDVRHAFPEIYNAIHTVENNEKEIKRVASSIVKSLKRRRNDLIKKQNAKAFVTTAVLAVCIVMQIITYSLSLKYQNASVLVLLGGLYNTFTLGYHQYYRLITYAFLHGGFLHLFFNMYALMGIGVFLENKFGHLKYALMLFSSILVGGLTQAILCQNTVAVGMSGGIYGLFVVYIAVLLSNRIINLNALLPTLLINLMLNFMSATAWAGHLGGAMAGFIFYNILNEEGNKKKSFIALLIIVIVVLVVKYVFYGGIYPFYLGTDQDVIKIIRDFGFNKYADQMMNNLFKIYIKYKGV